MHLAQRTFQILTAVFLLLLTSPVFIISLLLLVVTTRKGPFYKGERVGKDGKIFYMYKFRSLQPGSEDKIKARLLKPSDPFITPVGGVLRRLKIDELPQLFNVIKGEMNFIGPRPIRPIFYDYFLETLPHFQEKFNIKPGLTGLAQVLGNYQTPVISKLRYEIFYNSRKNFFLDLKIVLLTLRLLVSNLFARGKRL